MNLVKTPVGLVIRGSDLPPELQQLMKITWTKRHTGDHKDASIPLQFVNDAEWLARTWFAFNADESPDWSRGPMGIPTMPTAAPKTRKTESHFSQELADNL